MCQLYKIRDQYDDLDVRLKNVTVNIFQITLETKLDFCVELWELSSLRVGIGAQAGSNQQLEEMTA